MAGQNRVVMYSGYGRPFGSLKGKPRRKRKAPTHPKMKAQQKKLKACALEWRRGDSGHSTYRAHMKDCLRR